MKQGLRWHISSILASHPQLIAQGQKPSPVSASPVSEATYPPSSDISGLKSERALVKCGETVEEIRVLMVVKWFLVRRGLRCVWSDVVERAEDDLPVSEWRKTFDRCDWRDGIIP